MTFLAKYGLLLLLAVMMFNYSLLGQASPVSIYLQQTNLREAIRLLAKHMAVNVIISPSVNGVTTFSIEGMQPYQALEALLLANGLSVLKKDNLWWIAPKAEMIKSKQEETKWQEVMLDSTPLQMRVWQIQYAKVEDIARMLQEGRKTFLSKRGVLHIDSRTNILCIQDVPSQLQMLQPIIRQLDVPIKHIAISARLVNIDYDLERELGVNLAVKASADELVAPGRYSLAVATLADGSLLDVKLAALEKTGRAEIISTPSLFTANQQPASIEAGEEVPYQEVSESGGTAVAFKKAVLGLKVTPQVLPKNKVLLQLQINQDRPSNKMIQGVPSISTRQMTTHVIVNNGQTIVLGGIFETNEERGLRGLPFISQIPLIGSLLTRHSTRQNKRELLIFITPNIIVQTT